MSESIHKKLERVRKPRVHITYDVETEGAMVLKELPFVVGVLGDFSGDPTEALKPLKDRKFIQIDRDNFNDVMSAIGPRVAVRAPNRLQKDGDPLNVELRFRHIDDFSPVAIIEQVPALRKLFEGRKRLQVPVEALLTYDS